MPTTPSRGDVIADRYRIERELRAGGMAVVFVAEDLKHQRRVAVKVLQPELSASLGYERFLQEISVTANLQHPNILPLFDSGRVGGLLYYVMPFVEGESLRDKLDRERQLPVAEAVEIARSVAAALQFAHERGIVHRDIKPENVLIQAGQPLVADFGVALAVAQAGGGRMTGTGVTIGTAEYMSPEQASGEREIDGRSDLYSLACVLYEMLTGTSPHGGGPALSVLARIIAEEPASVGTRRPSVPPHVQVAVHRALEKLPADRFRTAAQFADALGGSATPGPSAAGPRASRTRERSWQAIAFAFALLTMGQ